MKKLEYPLYPKADWRIAISRRFNVPEIDELYFKSILPILKNEGIILECSSAPEKTESIDYWMHRFSTILQLSDIHIFLDIKRSANMEFEYVQSKNVRQGHYGLLTYNFGISPPFYIRFGMEWNRPITFTKPFVIQIHKKTLIDYFWKSKRKSTIGVENSFRNQEFRDRFRHHIRKAKQKRLKDLRRIEKYYEPILKRLNTDNDDLPASLKIMTESARSLYNGLSFESYQNEFREVMNEYPVFKIQNLNEKHQWLVKLYKGEVNKDMSFNEIRQKKTDELFEAFTQFLAIRTQMSKEDMDTNLEREGLFKKIIKFFAILNGWIFAIKIWSVHKRVSIYTNVINN